MSIPLKPVDNSPICDPEYLRQIDPVWTRGRVPNGFWHDAGHRRDYLLWLADRLGFRCLIDLYRLRTSNRTSPGAAALLVLAYWHGTALSAVRECFPDYDWKPWLFGEVPRGYWESPEHRRDYLDWLGKELRFRTPQDWYRICTADFFRNHGRPLLARYPSLYDLMREYLPELAWDRLAGRRPVSVEEILMWAEAYHSRHGKWPVVLSGVIPESGDTWRTVNDWLDYGFRGLPGGSSLAKLLAEHRGIPVDKRPPPLSEEQILAWADAYFAAHGKWPSQTSGPIEGAQETWAAVEIALKRGIRGMPGGSSVALLLAERRGKRKKDALSRLSEEQILAWADAHFAEHGKWPTTYSGPIPGAAETWRAVNMALRDGGRGLSRGSSLARLLAERRGKLSHLSLPPLTEEQILAWADAYRAKHGKWPTRDAGAIEGTRETWCCVHVALRVGGRGLSRRLSLAKLLAQRRGARNIMDLPPLSEKQILAWADAYFRAHGQWPVASSGPISRASEDWSAINSALRSGSRGLPRRFSLARLLAEQRRVRNPKGLPPLRETKILAWAYRFRLQHGHWPSQNSGPIPNSNGETWQGVNRALITGGRGLPGGTTLAKLIKQRGKKLPFLPSKGERLPDKPKGQ